MYFDEQDVVGESCGTQLDVDMLAPLAASLPSFTIVPRPSFLMPLPSVAASRIDTPTTTTGREDEDKEVEETLEKDDNEESDAMSSLRKLLRRGSPNEEGAAEPESLTARMAQMDAESLAALSIVVPPSQQDVEAAGLNANAMQRLHLQTPRKDDGDADGTHTDYDSFVGETPGTAVFKKERRNGNNKRPRSSASSPTSSSTSSSSTCASAVVLARKRALKESWRDRQMAVVPQQENSPVFDDEDDDQAPRITSFVEYYATDIDNLVIAPSQDYFDDAYDAEGENENEDQVKAEEEEDSANQSTQQQQMCGFVEFRERKKLLLFAFTQLNEECSEVFDDVIYAPKPVQLPPPSMMPPIREDDRRSQSHSPPRSAAAEPLKSESAAVEMKKENINSQADKEERDADNDSESSLSDGFDIPPVTKSNEAAIPKCPEPQLQPHAPPLPPPYQSHQQCKGQWNQRRSVKRDCTFIETQCASPVFEDDEDFEDDALPLSPRTGKCQHALAAPRIEELKADYIDSSSDDFEELSMKPDNITTTPTTTRSYNATGSPATASAARSPLRFQPRLLKKRRKARQLGLEPFFRSRPCT